MSGARVAGFRAETGRVDVKICGVTAPEHAAAAAEAGARYVGFVFEPRSPRAITPERAAEIALALDPELFVAKVGLWVDPTDAALEAALAVAPIDFIQLHGAETPARVREVRARTGLPVVKAASIAEAADLAEIERQSAAADMILVDAKPPKGATLTGGGGVAFDWSLLAGAHWTRPWMLAGGLTPDTVAEAIRATSAPAVDVSSGVEASRGVKDVEKIKAFVTAAHGAAARMRAGKEVV